MSAKIFRTKNYSGFSLVEFSIVILIIGLIVVGIIAGKKMITMSNLSKARALTNSSPVNGIEDLFLWLETTSKNSFSGSPVNGNAISTWYDLNPQLTSKGNATQATGSSQPIYTENAINGLPALKFDGIDDLLTSKTIDDWRFFQKGEEHSYFIVWQTSSADPNNFSLPISTSNADVITGVGMDFVLEDRASQGRNQQVWAGTGGAGVAIYGATSGDNAANYSKANIASVTFKYGIAGNDAKLYVNGALVASTEGNNLGFTAANSNSTIYIGADYQLAWPFGGYIAEIIIFKHQLSDFERADVEKYLSKKWNIPLS